MAKRKFDESKVKRDESGRFVAQAGIGKQHDLKSVMAGQAKKAASRSKPKPKPKATPRPKTPRVEYGKGPGRSVDFSYKAERTVKQNLQRQRATRKATGYGFTNVR